MEHTHVTLNHGKEFVNKQSAACTKPGKSFHFQNKKVQQCPLTWVKLQRPIYLNVKTVIAEFILKKLSTWNNPYLIWSPRNIYALYDQRRFVIKCAEWTENQWGGKVKALLTYFPNFHNGIESARFLIIAISGKIFFP